MVERGQIEYNDKRLKTNLWMQGVYYYTMAIPFVIASNVIYFINFRTFTNETLNLDELFPEDSQTDVNLENLVIPNKSIVHDQKYRLQIQYYRYFYQITTVHQNQ
jgi:hypothetical protein